MAISHKKNTTPRGSGNWTKLDTPGDVGRLLRWLILQTKEDKIDAHKASIMGQLGMALLKTLEAVDVEKRLDEIEKQLSARIPVYDTNSTPPTH